MTDRFASAPTLPVHRSIEHSTRPFGDSRTGFSEHSDAVAACALNAVIGAGGLSPLHAVYDEGLPPATRLDCIRAIGDLVEHTFAPRCPQRLSNTRGVTSSHNLVCSMRWDVACALPRGRNGSLDPSLT